MWAPFARLAGERELIAFDAPGAGLSQRPRRPLRMRAAGAHREGAAGRARRSSASTCSATRSAARSRRSSRDARPSASGGWCCARPGPGLGGVPPRPMAALMLATPARYYHPRLLALSVPHIAGGRTRARAGRARRARGRAPGAARRTLLGYAYQLYAAAGWSSLPWLHRVRSRRSSSPAMTIPACRCATPACSRPGCPNARLHVVKGGGHLFLLDEPRERRRTRSCAFLDAPDAPVIGAQRASANLVILTG